MLGSLPTLYIDGMLFSYTVFPVARVNMRRPVQKLTGERLLVMKRQTRRYTIMNVSRAARKGKHITSECQLMD